MKRSDFAADRPIGAILAIGSAFALLLALFALALLAMAGEEGRREVARESDRLAALGASRRLLTHLDQFLWTLSGACLLGVFKGIAVYRGTRTGFRFAIAVNLLAVAVLLPWIAFENVVRGAISAATLLVIAGSLITYCWLRLLGRTGPRPGG